MSRPPPLPFRLLERFLPSSTADAVVGDLIERQLTGVRLWRETLIAIWHLRDRTPNEVELMSSFLSDLRLAARLLARPDVHRGCRPHARYRDRRNGGHFQRREPGAHPAAAVSQRGQGDGGVGAG